MRQVAVLAGLVSIISCPTLSAQADGLRIRDSIVILPNGTQWQPRLHRIRYLDTFQVDGITYYLLVGYPCIEGCDVEGGAYLLRPGLTIYSDTGAAGIGYPGPKVQVGDQEPSGYMRVFWGRCLTNSGQQFLAFWHQGKALPTDSVAPGDSAHIVTAFRDSLSVRNIPLTAAVNAIVQSQIRRSQCHELT